MPFDVLPATGLATNAYDRLHRFFNGTAHRPSQEQWAAIRDLHDHLELAAKGQLPEALYLSAIPPGTGKSTATAMFARALMDHPVFEETGMVIFVNRIVEAEAMAELIGPDYRDKLCVITSKEEAKEVEKRLGAHTDANYAQVVVCTQAALKQTLKANGGITFGGASRFHFRGSRRAVVSWDESFAFNRPVVLNADVAVKLAEAMSRQSKEAATTLKRWSADMDTLTGLITVPDFEGLGIDFDRLEEAVGGHDDLVAVVKSLTILNRDEGFVTNHGASSALVTCCQEINPSLMPVIVTDASAKVNASYVQMAKTRPVRRLTDAPKTYRNMTLRLVNTAASRSVYRDTKTTRGRDLLDIAVRYIESVPANESVLVVGYKGWFRMKGVAETNLELALRKRLKPHDEKRVAYLPYGQHTATNAFQGVRHVLLLGLNFIPKAAGHAASGAALDLNTPGVTEG
jgi:hypothetical protein